MNLTVLVIESSNLCFENSNKTHKTELNIPTIHRILLKEALTDNSLVLLRGLGFIEGRHFDITASLLYLVDFHSQKLLHHLDD